MRFVKGFLLLFIAILLVGGILLYEDELPADIVDAKYSSPASQFLIMDNKARVHFRDEGNTDGATIVLIHGSNASLHTWEPWVAELGDQYRVVSMDLPGHGLTGGTPDKDYSSKAQVNTVAAVVDHLELESFVLGGNSMGGGVTWRYALAHPGQVSAMILVDASGPSAWWLESRAASADSEEREAPLAFQLLRQPWFRAIAKYVDSYWLVEQGVRSAYNNSPVIDQALFDRYYELSFREGTREATLDRFGSEPDWSEESDLALLTQPTLVMWGKEDSLIPVDVADRFVAELPNATAVIYDDVGHIPMEEIPKRSAKDVLDFLADL